MRKMSAVLFLLGASVLYGQQNPRAVVGMRIESATESHEKDAPSTRLSARIPASLVLMGATMKSPYLDESGQRELLKQLRATAEWDLDDPATS